MKEQKPDLQRRSLLKALTISTAAGVAVAASQVTAAPANEGVENATSHQDGYRETAHIRDYYNSLR
ncbi:formate dehydrogenase [Shewanella sp. YIC-542]|uniref:formate dehydrogenase n=1 Tax=Shewanella mytili TaxID=3377111 RepID=UPI00398ECA38